MTEGSFGERNPHAAQAELTPRFQTMDVIADADAMPAEHKRNQKAYRRPFGRHFRAERAAESPALRRELRLGRGRLAFLRDIEACDRQVRGSGNLDVPVRAHQDRDRMAQPLDEA